MIPIAIACVSGIFGVRSLRYAERLRQDPEGRYWVKSTRMFWIGLGLLVLALVAAVVGCVW